MGDIADDLTLDELCAFVAGADLWTTPGSERLGIGPLVMTDGPNGARGSRWTGVPSACFPCGSALGATWDVELVRAVGEALGAETRHKGAHLLLAPTVNLHRHPLGGRHFECLSEDPYLTAALAVAYVRGVQSQGVGCTIKHFVANDTEYQRMTISSDVDERTLRELYLVPFEAAVTRAGVWAVMSAYNKLNGTSCSEHRWLLCDLLKGEWGFDGIVVSDWFGTYSTVASARNGLDVEMPGRPVHWGRALAEAVRAGEVDEAVVRDKARRVVRTLERVGARDDRSPRVERSEPLPGHDALIRRAGAAAMVLLRNEGLLPLDPATLHAVAVIGPNAATAQIQGGGSAAVTPHHAVSPLDGLRAALEPRGVRVHHERGCSIHRRVPPVDRAVLGPDGLTCRYLAPDGGEVLTETSTTGHFLWFGSWSPAVPPGFGAQLTGTLTPTESGRWTLALTVAGDARLRLDGEVVVDAWGITERSDAFFGFGTPEQRAEVDLQEGRTYTLEVEYSSASSKGFGALTVGCLPPAPDDLMDRAATAAAAADVAVVVVGTNADWETEGHARASLELPGRQVDLIRRVAAVNPRTVVVLNCGSPVDVSWVPEVPAVLLGWFAGQEWGHALTDVLLGVADPGGRLPTTWPKRLEDTPAFTGYPGDEGHVRYGEGVFIGYRWYDTRRLEPAFPFGHGLSYTTFTYGEPVVTPGADGRTADVRVTVTNTGSRPGTEVVQCYVHHPESSVQRPEQELKAFAKVVLEPGASREVTLRLDERAFAFWSTAHQRWVVEPGEVEIRLGSSSRALRAATRCRVGAQAG